MANNERTHCGKPAAKVFGFIVCLMLCLVCLPLPALAEDIIWNGPGAPGNTGQLRPDPHNPNYLSLFPDGPSGNRVIVNGDLPEEVYGGLDYYTDDTAAESTGNRLTINGGTVGNFVHGGYARIEFGSGTATARSNSVTINGGTLGATVYGGYAGTFSGSATATDNSVTVNGGTLNKEVYGGYAWSDFGNVAARNNSVTINGGSVGIGLIGGQAMSDNSRATATGNSVAVRGGSIAGQVMGGYAGSVSGDVTARDNKVTISGGSIGDGVFGGSAATTSGSATATGNSVTLSGAPLFAPTSEIWGGEALVGGIPGGDSFSDNTLNVWNYSGSPVSSLQNFQYYNFALPASLQNGDTLLSVAGNAYFDDSRSGAATGVQSTVTDVSIMGGGTPLQAGDSVVLIGSSGGSGTISNNGAVISGTKGVSLLYDFRLDHVGNTLSATVLNVDAHPQAKALSEGRAAGLAFVNQGADLVAGTGMSAAGSAGYGLSAFTAFQGGASRYDTGSHVDVDGFSLLAGLAWNGDTEYGKLLLGAFFEAGWGNYDSHNSFSGYASVKGDGNTEYTGGGVLGRFDFADSGPGHIYAETSFRAGWAKTDFSSSDLRDGTGQKADYDSGAAYYGAHLGLGYLWNITEASSLDLYTKYFWTRQASDSVTVTGDPVRFKSADSHRWRGGARFSHALATESGLVLTPYIGAAYEHEFDGKAGATVYGYSLDAPDLEGGTGMGELGLSFKTLATSGLSLDLGVQSYTGVREGLTGSFQFKWEF